MHSEEFYLDKLLLYLIDISMPFLLLIQQCQSTEGRQDVDVHFHTTPKNKNAHLLSQVGDYELKGIVSGVVLEQLILLMH